jgi:hypothetical protein
MESISLFLAAAAFLLAVGTGRHIYSFDEAPTASVQLSWMAGLLLAIASLALSLTHA